MQDSMGESVMQIECRAFAVKRSFPQGLPAGSTPLQARPGRKGPGQAALFLFMNSSGKPDIPWTGALLYLVKNSAIPLLSEERELNCMS